MYTSLLREKKGQRKNDFKEMAHKIMGGWLKIQVRVDVAVLCLNSIGQQAENSG